MHVVTTPKKIANILVVITFFNNKPSGIDKPTTAIEKAITVPSGMPFSTKTCITGNIPAALLYIGTPKITAIGTAKGLFLLI